jgi:hypothetical protein
MTKFSNAQCKRLANDILSARTITEQIGYLSAALDSLPRDAPGWRTALLKLQLWLVRARMLGMEHAKPAYGIFSKGNGKLPFWSFSALPGVTCPGAGACLEFCYSFTAWRFPYAFARQLQNTILLRSESGRQAVRNAFDALRENAIVRLYVDGDFESIDIVQFWFDALGDREDIRAYGYSKSWVELLAYAELGHAFPSNYVLNLSSGSLHSDDTRARMLALPITRGDFGAVGIDTQGLPRGVKRYNSREYHSRVRSAALEQTGKRIFSCPGKCGDCRASAGMHACGDRHFVIPIAIGIH